MGTTYIWMISLVLLCMLHEGSCEQPINITFGDVTQVIMFERQEETVNVSVVSYDGNDVISVYFESENLYTFEVVNKTFARFEINPETIFPMTFAVTVKGRHIGISELRVLVAALGSDSSEQVASLVVKIKVGNAISQVILQYVFYAPIISALFMMGATMDVEAIAGCFKHPLPIFIGFFCQFVVMPALSLGIVKLVGLDGSYALGLLLLGCSPSGKTSNDLTVLLDADYVLSITMTACSTTLALAMMPLNIFIYTRFLTEANIETPYAQIAMQIAILMTPVLLGILLKYKFPQVKEKVLKILKPVLVIIMLASAAMTMYYSWYIFLSPPTVYLAAFLLPFCGGILGGLIAKLSQLPNAKVIAVSMETGVQNGLFTSLVLRVVYPSPEADLATAVPSLAFFSMLFIGILIIISRMVFNRFFSRKDAEDTQDIIQRHEAEDDSVEDHNGKGIELTSINMLDQEEVMTEDNNNDSAGNKTFPHDVGDINGRI
ncbi:ileal sodium/bile acid cotransporter-like [Strongylocentrotus purpuratus]|uniref:Ileal sodium/bile acid cotransporter n=1 Tax=Strongylocentrotus purpuratus TaxID=7668 RepID=A0A7M7HFH9_STRPU|nr:ileal sodium/bile acid cotransporter-like [Strongylocentrotus purpuratus]|eukprot:XP_011662356.1 PREDICTED: ileal sodium/bile acid cotransporter-like [Strongylocentrotus purpuratus]